MCIHKSTSMCAFTHLHIYVCTYIYPHTYAYIRVSTSTSMYATQHTYTCIHTYTRTHINSYIYVHAHSNICMNIHIYVYAQKFIYMLMCIYLHIWVYAHVCIHAHICTMGTHSLQVHSTHTFSPSGGWLLLCWSSPFPAVLFSWISSHVSIFVLIYAFVAMFMRSLPRPMSGSFPLHFLLAVVSVLVCSTPHKTWFVCEMKTSFILSLVNIQLSQHHIFIRLFFSHIFSVVLCVCACMFMHVCVCMLLFQRFLIYFEIRSYLPLALFFLRTSLAIWDSLWLHRNFIIFF